VKFYENALGLKLKSRDFVARFDMDGVLFELVPGQPGGQGNARLCLAVDDIETAIHDLQSKGITTSAAARKSNGLLATFHDPDGNEVCLWQYADAPPIHTRTSHTHLCEDCGKRYMCERRGPPDSCPPPHLCSRCRTDLG
jgi:predicted enzyme related to lactoylglutathione lyase